MCLMLLTTTILLICLSSFSWMVRCWVQEPRRTHTVEPKWPPGATRGRYSSSVAPCRSEVWERGSENLQHRVTETELWGSHKGKNPPQKKQKTKKTWTMWKEHMVIMQMSTTQTDKIRSRSRFLVCNASIASMLQLYDSLCVQAT